MSSKDCVKALRGQVFYYNPIWSFTGKNEKYNKKLLQGHLESKTRPYLVISNDDGNFTSTCCNIIPITTREEVLLPCQVKFNYEGRSQVILIEQVITANIKDLGDYLYTISNSVLEQVEVGIMMQFGIKNEDINLTFNDLYSKLQTIVDQVISSSKERVETLKRKQIDDISLHLCESVEDMMIGLESKKENNNEALIDENFVNFEEDNNLKKEDDSKNLLCLSEISKVSQNYMETISKRNPRMVWNEQKCREFLSDCKTLKIEDIVVKYNFKNKRGVYDKRHYLKRKGIV